MARSTPRTVLFTVFLTLGVVVAAGLVVMYTGAYNVAATKGHTGLVRWALHETMERSVALRAGNVGEPPTADSSMIEHGFEHFRAMCVDCHGAPGVERGDFGQGMTPEPPELSSDEMAERTPQEIFWVTKHGVKVAGMPAFAPTHSDEEIWAIVHFVERLQEMSPEEYARWEERHTATGEDEDVHSTEDHSHGGP